MPQADLWVAYKPMRNLGCGLPMSRLFGTEL